jgi:hypothetical protein
MAYSIRYGSCKYDVPKPKVRDWKRYILITAAAAVVMFALLFPHGAAKVRKALFPYFEKNVQEAFGGMVQDIRRGEPFSDASAAFVQEMISDAAV